VAAAVPAQFLSYPPLRPLPKSSDRPMPATPARFVDPVNGNDSAAGSMEQPWKTLNFALRQLRAGDTLCLRGGIYWEHVTASPKGSVEAPITVRSYPGEIAILDGGYREFFEDPANAWETVPANIAPETLIRVRRLAGTLVIPWSRCGNTALSSTCDRTKSMKLPKKKAEKACMLAPA
jgi:hypothetical protein